MTMDLDVIKTRFLHAQHRPVIVLGRRYRTPLRARIVAARHEIRCGVCRISWPTWVMRLAGKTGSGL